MIRLITLSAFALVLAACASTEPQDDTEIASARMATATSVAEIEEKVDEGDKLVCVRERVTGSNRMEKVCRFQSEIDRDRQATQQGVRQLGSRNPRHEAD